MRSKRQLLNTTALSAMIAYAFLAGAAAHANPVDGVVSAGSADITANGKTLDITQHSDKAIIDWRGFDIAHDETTNFYQPSSSSIILNRVHSSQASQIDGKLNANGNVVIINQNGIVFGAGAQVDVHGLVATTSDTTNAQFMNNAQVRFDLPGNTSASIVNNGTITAHDAGLVGFVAPNVENNGVITANLGRVHLAAGDKATVDFYGDGLLEVEASDQLQHEIVKNTGTITADGGKIAMTAAKGGQVVSSLINAQGVIKAQSVGVRNGEIIIGGHKNVKVSGTIDASSTTGKGGKVTITADNIKLDTNARINTSGHTGGGTILIGGDYQGSGTTPRAKTLIVEQGAYIRNDALLNGDGGKTILWSDEFTSFAGLISGKGGAQGGDGGFAEVSGKDVLQFDGYADLSADEEAGFSFGTLLLDPSDITIASGTDSGGSFSSGTYTGSAASSVISLATLTTQLAGGSNVLITTSNGQSGNGDITVAGNISVVSARTLVLTSTRDIHFNGTYSNTSTGALTLNGGRDINLNANITLGNANNITATAARDLTIASGVTLSSGPTGTLSLRAAGGVITNTGVFTNNGVLNVGSGGTMILSSGLDSLGTRTTDLTLTGSNMTLQGASIGAVTITGFRDVAVNRTLPSTGIVTITADRDFTNSGVISTSGGSSINITSTTRDVIFGANVTGGAGSSSIIALAQRHLTINSGVTIAAGATGALNLRAAGASTSNTGILTLNGVISVASGTLVLLSGLDSLGARADLTLTTSNMTVQGATIGAANISGFRDININRTLPSSNSITLAADRDLTTSAVLSAGTGTTYSLTANRDIVFGANINSGGGTTGVVAQAGRNLTVNSGAILSAAATGAISLKAAGGVITNTGVLAINGVMNIYNGGLTLLSGLDSGGTRTTDLTINNTNLTLQGTTVGGVSITGFRDIIWDRSLTSTSSITTVAERNQTINTGMTLATGSTGAIALRAAGGNIANTGILTINGTVSIGSANTTSLISGLDSMGNRADLTLSSSNFVVSNTTLGITSITGFRDVVVDRDIASTNNLTIAAERNLTINSGATVTGGAAATLTLTAAGSAITNTGLLVNNGTISVGTGALSLRSGVNGSGNRADLTLTNGNLLFNGAGGVVGTVSVTGFRDVTVNRAITSSGIMTLTAERNLNTNATLAAAGLAFRAGGGVATNTGIITNTGLWSQGTSSFTVAGGVDGSGNKGDLVLNNTNFLMSGATIGAISLTGLRDVTIDSALIGGSTMAITNDRDLFINAQLRTSTNNTMALAVGRDVVIAAAINANGNTNITAARHVTVNSGATISTGNYSLQLRASGGNNANTGVLTLNGTLNGNASGSITLSSGLDTLGNRADITFNSSTLTYSTTINGFGISGFRDITVARDITITSSGLQIVADRHLTVNSGVTIAGAPSGAVTLRAAGGVVTATGVLSLNGAVSMGSGSLILLSGVDSLGDYGDLNLTSGKLITQGASLGGVTISGFRDININSSFASSIMTLTSTRDITLNNAFTGALNFTAGRDLTFAASAAGSGAGSIITGQGGRHLSVNSGVTLASGSTGGISLKSAGGVITNTGTLTLNGTLSTGTGALTLLTGLDGSAARTQDLVLNANPMISLQGASTGTLNISGYRDITIDRNLAVAGATIVAERNLTIATGSTLTSSAALTLRSAGGSGTTGLLSIDGNITLTGNHVMTLVGGTGSILNFDSSHFTLNGGSMGGLSVSAFRDVIFGQNVNFTGSTSVIAERNLTINSGVTITAPPANNITLRAGGASAANIGTVSINGMLSVTNGQLIMSTGLDNAGQRTTDLTFDTSWLTLLNPGVIGGLNITGYRDITFARDFSFNFAGSTINALRNLTVNSGVTLTAASTFGISLRAADAVTTGTGRLSMNGTIRMGTGPLTLLSGHDGSGNYGDITLNSSNLQLTGASMGGLTLGGFRDITLDRALPAAFMNIAAMRHLTVNGEITTSGSGMTTLSAANGVATNTGVLAINAKLNLLGSGSVSLLSGKDTLGNNADFTLSSGNYAQGGTISALTISGYRDMVMNTNVTTSGGMTLTAVRDLTINNGITLTTGTGNGITLRAAGNTAGQNGALINNGLVRYGSSLTLYSGADSLTRGVDFVWNGITQWQAQGANAGIVAVSGFRDVLFNENITLGGNLTLQPLRDIVIASGKTMTALNNYAVSMYAANALYDQRGVVSILGNLVLQGSNNLAISSGLNASGLYDDLVWDGGASLNITRSGPIAGFYLAGYRDITVAQDIASTGIMYIKAGRNLTINNGVTVSNTNGTTKLTAGNSAALYQNNGVVTNNGVVKSAGDLTLQSGLSVNVIADLDFNNTHYQTQSGTYGNVLITGFRDVTLNQNMSLNGDLTVTAQRNLTLPSSTTLTSNTNGKTFTLNAANGVITNQGVLTMDGYVISKRTGLILYSGQNGSGGVDFTYNNTHFTETDVKNGSMRWHGFRDVTFASNYTSSGFVDVTAQRNLTVNSGVTLQSNSGNSTVLYAAGGNPDAAGYLRIDGNLSLGHQTTRIVSGYDVNTGERPDLVFDASKFTYQGGNTNVTQLYLTGFRDITMGQSVNSTTKVDVRAYRTLTMNAGVTLTATTLESTLVAEDFINNSGSNAISSSGGRWLVYSNDSTTSKMGGLAYDFRVFSCAYGAACAALPGTGNGFVFATNGTLELVAGIKSGTALPSAVVRAPQTVDANVASNANNAGTAGGPVFEGGWSQFYTSNTPSKFSEQGEYILTFAPELAAKFDLKNWQF